MKKIFYSVLLFIAAVAGAQEPVVYVAAKTGLSIREKPETSAKVLGKIPYGTKISLSAMNEAAKNINTEGLSGTWRKVTYDNKTGYIVDSYLFSIPPPKASAKTMKDYLAQLSAPAGAKLEIKKTGIEGEGSILNKQLYKNGAEWHEFLGYEYNSDTYFLPDFTMQQGFLLIRLLEEFKEAVSEKDEFPVKSKTVNKGDHEYAIKVENETVTDLPLINRITIEFESGAYYKLELFQLDNQLVVFYGGGV
jgi:hypothetical protein